MSEKEPPVDPDDIANKKGSLGAFALRAELFHQILMEDFRFMEAARMESGEYEAANLNTDDLRPMSKVKDLMLTNSQALVNFASYEEKTKNSNTEKYKDVIVSDFRTRRFTTRMSKWPPLSIFAHWLINTRSFRALMIAVIVLNSIQMAIDGELGDTTDKTVRAVMDSIDFFFLTMFVAEISLKFIDGFRIFWSEYWNIFDFGVTTMSLIAPILDVITQGSADDDRLSYVIATVKYIRILRILRSLNVVTRISKIMVIWAAITQTAKSLLFITTLMLLFFYIFAVIGTQLFERFNHNHRTDLGYKDSFRSLSMAMISLFQLFTLDKWYELILTLGDGSGGLGVPCTFCLVWILLGSFIFRNIFVGVMVNNFQDIRKQFMDDQATHEVEEEDEEKENILGLSPELPEGFEGFEDPLIDWEEHIFNELELLKIRNRKKDVTSYIWPRDTLFLYYVLLQSLANNCDERDKILTLLNQALMRHYER